MREVGSNENVVVGLNRNLRIESKMKLESLHERGFDPQPFLLRSIDLQRVLIDRIVDERVEGVEVAFRCTGLRKDPLVRIDREEVNHCLGIVVRKDSCYLLLDRSGTKGRLVQVGKKASFVDVDNGS